MIARIKSWDRRERATAIGIAVVTVMGFVAAFSGVEMAGTKTGAVLALVCVLGVPLLYAAIVRPVLFPFAVYAFLTPFDTLLVFSQIGTLSKLLGLLTAAAILFYMLRTRRFGEPPRAVVLWILFYLWATASAWWAIDAPSALDLLQTSWALLALFLVVSMFRIDLARLRLAAFAVTAGGFAAAAYGLYFFHSDAATIAARGNRLWIENDTSQINPDHFANALILPLSLALVGTLWSRGLAARIFCGAALIAMLVALVLSGSRGAALGLLAVIAYLLVRDRHRLQLAIFGGFAAGGVVAVTGATLLQRFAESLTTGGAGRVSIWQTGLAALKENWMFGAGYGNFPFAYDRAYIHVFETFNAEWHRASHNILLGTGVELGIVGLVLLIWAWVATYRLLSPIGEDDPRHPIVLGVQAAIIGLFVAGMFADIMITKYVWLAFIMSVMTYGVAPVAGRSTAFSPAAEAAANA